jgi:hypothetical protein
MTPLPADRVLDHFFLEARSRLLDLAAILDRIARGNDATRSVESDARMEKLVAAIRVLSSDAPNKAELIQQLFSLEYDPNWQRPRPRF